MSKCDICNRDVENREIFQANYLPDSVCSDCIAREYQQCPECGRVLPIDIYFSYTEEAIVCEECDRK